MGCGARLISSWDIHDKWPWAAQKLLLLWGPALIMFTVNLTSTELAKTYKANNFIPPRIARPLYFAVNTVLFLLLSLATFMDVATAGNEVHAGHNLLKSVLIIRLTFWFFVMFNNAASPNNPHRNLRDGIYVAPESNDYYCVLQDFFIVAFVQNIVQLIRLYSRSDGFMNLTEWPLYALDIFLAVRSLLDYGIWYWPDGCEKVIGR